MIAKHPSWGGRVAARLLRFSLALAPLLLCESVAAATVTFTKIADTSTPVPGGTGNFIHFSSPAVLTPAIDGGKVAFYGTGRIGKRLN